MVQMIELIKEVKELQGLVRVQGEKIEDIKSNLDEKIKCLETKLSADFEKSQTKQDMRSKKIESKVVKAIGEMKLSFVESIGGLESKLAAEVGKVESKVTKVDRKIEVSRSEVRLVSQQKLTWQNSTYGEKLFSEYAVDGVYTASGDLFGLNPIQHMGGNHKNFMLIINLGGLFKIHTVKVWNRIDCCQTQSVGVYVYADDELLGGLNEAKLLYNFRARDKVYARNIYLKQSINCWMNLREVQVFGTGPYGEDEIE